MYCINLKQRPKMNQLFMNRHFTYFVKAVKRKMLSTNALICEIAMIAELMR